MAESQHFTLSSTRNNNRKNQQPNNNLSFKKDTLAAQRMRLYRQRLQEKKSADESITASPMTRRRALTGAERTKLWYHRKKLAKKNALYSNIQSSESQNNEFIKQNNNLKTSGQSLLKTMPKKVKPIIETRICTRRAASKVALKQMQKICQKDVEDEPETLEILSDEEVLTVEPPKKKYKVCHRKSSDGNERDIIVLRSLRSSAEPCLNLEAWQEDLSPIQKELWMKQQTEYQAMTEKIDQLLESTGAEVIFQGDSLMAFEIDSAPTVSTSRVVSATPSSVSPLVPPPPATQPVIQSTSKSNGSQSIVSSDYSFVVDPKSGQVVGTFTPAPPTPPMKTRKRARSAANSPIPPAKISKTIPAGPPPLISLRPTEATAVGGLQHLVAGAVATAPRTDVVDLTSDDGKPSADSKEISFTKLQGKTFPSLVVVARPNLRVPNSSVPADRSKLDLKVKSVLLHPPTKFTEWLIQQGLIRAEQNCSSHLQNKLKLGMYSDVSKFPFSGGYVWISECCPQRFVSVFSGSLFEASPHSPAVLLKLIYHWACQTNVQNVIQWVKVENWYVKGLNTWLRAACTVALYTHLPDLGGPGVNVQIGVISLGTTSQDGQQRQVKVEVLGILETESRKIRLRAVEPLADNEKNFKKRFAKILEPLTGWVHKESIIVTDLTVDKNTLFGLGFRFVSQNKPSGGNQQIMDYLRRIVPRMFQNTLSLLSRPIIQQFLDELVWREWFGTTAAEAFDNILTHIAEQTRIDTGQSLIVRLNRVATNPFVNSGIQNYLETVPPPVVEVPKRMRRKQQLPKSVSPTNELIKPPKTYHLNQTLSYPELMVPLEHYYYGTFDGNHKTDQLDLTMKCMICKEVQQFTNNIDIMMHYFRHAHSVTGQQLQCQYCLATVTSKANLDVHIKSTHPTQTKQGNNYTCVICERKFTSIYYLGRHMSTEHWPSELPYRCGSCSFACSSHKETIDHFHSVHNHEGVVQCPFCLKSISIVLSGRHLPQKLHFFLTHLQKHQRKSLAKKCPNCSLTFIQKEPLKEHMKFHVSQKKKVGLRRWALNGILSPKCIKDYVEDDVVDIGNLSIDVPVGSICKECDEKITNSNHYPCVLSCVNENCNYVTCCKKAESKHAEVCKDFKKSVPPMPLPFTLYCVCGYSDNDGNLMAKHLAVCERQSAYPSVEAAKEASVTHSMLDVLGLVRKPEESVTDVSEKKEETVIDKKVDKTEDNKDKVDEKGKENEEVIKVDGEKGKVVEGKDKAEEEEKDKVKEKEEGKENEETIVIEEDKEKVNMKENTNEETSNTNEETLLSEIEKETFIVDGEEDEKIMEIAEEKKIEEKDIQVIKDVEENVESETTVVAKSNVEELKEQVDVKDSVENQVKKKSIEFVGEVEKVKVIDEVTNKENSIEDSVDIVDSNKLVNSVSIDINSEDTDTLDETILLAKEDKLIEIPESSATNLESTQEGISSKDVSGDIDMIITEFCKNN